MGEPVERRVQAVATAPQRAMLRRLSPAQFPHTELAGEQIEQVLDRAPGNNAPIGGIKVIAKSGWFAARPSGTEDIYRIYAESFLGEDHLTRIVEEAPVMVDDMLAEHALPMIVLSRGDLETGRRYPGCV
jgi:phosphoglucomutase